MNELRILRTDNSITSQEIVALLENMPEWDPSVVLEVRQEPHEALRTLDPTVVVALVTMTGTALGALVTGLLQIAQAISREKIVLETKDGLHIEIEARNARKRIPELIKLVKSMEIERIRL